MLVVHWGALWAAFGLLVVLGFLTVESLMSGSYPLSAAGVWASLTGHAISDIAHTVVWEFRFPRTLAAALAGALFGILGAVLQNVSRNRLADLSLVGVS